MAYIKTYKTRANEARVIFELGSVTVDAHFKDGNIRDNVFATMTTRDPLVQKVIEASSLFGKKVFLESAIEIAEPVTKAETETTVLENITTMQELREYIASNFNINIKTITSPNALKAKVREFGLELPNMVW